MGCVPLGDPSSPLARADRVQGARRRRAPRVCARASPLDAVEHDGTLNVPERNPSTTRETSSA